MLPTLGLAAGIVTTVAGMGGGMLLVLALSAWWADPALALTVTAPALWVGNVHRLVLFRRHVALRRIAAFVGGVAPGAMVGALLTVIVAPWLLQLALVGAASLAGATALGWVRIAARPAVMGPAGVAVGLVGATGGAGPVAGPVLLATGLTGAPYVASLAATSVTLHSARIAVYGATGWLDASALSASGWLVVGLVAGNFAGRWLRLRVPEAAGRPIEVGMVGVLLSVAVVGLC